MIKNEIAQKYSQALFELGKEENNLLDLRSEINELWEVINESEDLQTTLFHHRILPEDKKKILYKIFKEDISGTLFNFICLLIDKRREYFLEPILNRFNQLVDKEEKLLNIEVVSAIPLTEDLKQKLTNKLNQILDNKITIEEKCDPSLIGGMILKIDDYIIDGSVRNSLESLGEKIQQISLSKLGV